VNQPTSKTAVTLTLTFTVDGTPADAEAFREFLTEQAHQLVECVDCECGVHDGSFTIV
jgi:hypothetical protein